MQKYIIGVGECGASLCESDSSKEMAVTGEHNEVYLAADVDAFLSVNGLTKLTDRIIELEKALRSIANSNCCGDCQEAKRVATSALMER